MLFQRCADVRGSLGETHLHVSSVLMICAVEVHLSYNLMNLVWISACFVLKKKQFGFLC